LTFSKVVGLGVDCTAPACAGGKNSQVITISLITHDLQKHNSPKKRVWEWIYKYLAGSNGVI